MSNASDNTLEFQCPKCARRLRASPQAAGKRLKCPGCGQPVKVPGGTDASNSAAQNDDDWLNLDAPAATSPPPRSDSKPSPKPPSPKPPTKQTTPAQSADRRPSAASPSAAKQSSSGKPPSSTPSSGLPSSGTSSSGKGVDADKRSIFDDDLPELAELEAPRPRMDMVNILGIEGLDELVPVKPKPAGTPPAPTPAGNAPPSKKNAALDPANQQYRVPCPTCGTPQYVTVAKQGRMIKCPDCFADFKIPPPPPGSKSTKPANTNWGTGLKQESEADVQKDAARQRASADEYLRKAEQELNDEDIDNLYQGEFDTKGFVARTFGFLFDAPALFQIVVYSIIFGLLFTVTAWCMLKMAEGDKGVALLAAVAIPLLSLMASFPMFSGAMTLLESVANGESKVQEWPGFNIFDHIGELLLFAVAVAASAIPGFLIGSYFGQSGGMGWLITLATMLTTFIAFPIILLSMMDNGSLFNPISPDVFKSLSVGYEAWGVYYFKTLIGYSIVFVAWSILLSGNMILAGLAGALLPLLLFFTTQQLGVLAHDIGEHLSLLPRDDDEEADDKD